MKAAVFYGVHNLRVQARELPEVTPGHVLLRVAACGICGTDRHIVHGDYDTHPPVILGHEYAGEVVAVGEGVSRLQKGDRVAVDPNMPCGVCRFCRRGDIYLCESLLALGVDVDGGFAEYTLTPQQQCYLLPDAVSSLAGADWPLWGAMTEPLACCLRGIDRANIKAGDTVVVIGGGAIGLMLAQLARLRGAARLLLSDPIPARREMARALGVDAAIDPLTEDPLATNAALVGGADVVIEAVGSRTTTQQAVAWSAPGATILWFGVTPPGHTIPVEPNEVFRKELSIRGARMNPYTHDRALALLASGQVQVEPLITRTIDLDALPGVLLAPPGGDVKTVVVP